MIADSHDIRPHGMSGRQAFWIVVACISVVSALLAALPDM
jgi:uncharacterized membrane protein YhaH (DUF805 family)